MSTYDEENGRDMRVILAWIILALQIIGLLWLLLFARDRLAAMGGQQAEPTAVAVVEATDVPEATAVPEATEAVAATDEPAPEPTAEPETAIDLPTAEEAGVLRQEDVVVDTGGLAQGEAAPEWLAQVVEGVAPDPDAGVIGVPPHLLLGFPDAANPGLELAAPDAIDLSRPQVRVVPIAALLAWLAARGDAAGQEALDELQSLLDEQPAADEASVPLPPVVGEGEQALVARVGYRTFEGGQGVGYVARVAGDNALPATNESGLTYIYQGLSDDGEQYVFMSWPIDATFLPETAGDVTDDATTMMTADPAAYYNDLAAQVEAAADDDLRPNLRRLATMIGTLGLAGRLGSADAAAQVSPGTPEDAAGFVWNWTASRDDDGAETAVADPQNYTLVFWPDGMFSFKADCNVGRGRYTVNDDGTVSLEPGAMTLALCPPDSQDTEFLAALAAAQTIGFDESGDMIVGLADSRSAVFANVGTVETEDAAAAEDQPGATDAGFTGLNLQWPGFTDAGGSLVEVENPENYTLALLPDGTFTFRADCNIGSGTYTYGDDGALVLDLGPMTAVACDPASQSDTFLGFLSGVSGVSVADSTVTMTTADGGSAVFVNGGPLAEETGAQAAPEGDLLDIVWQWTSLDAGGTVSAVANPERYYLVLLDDGTYTFVADCNRGAGGYSRDGVTLTLDPAAATLVACEAGSLSDQFIGFFGQIVSYGFDGDNLLLTLADGSVLTLANGGPFTGVDTGTPDVTVAVDLLAGTTWRWFSFRDAKQSYDVPATTDYTIAFNADGTVNVVADCNTGNGSYTMNADGDLTIGVLATTRAACPAGSLDVSFVEYLNQAQSFAFSDTGMSIILAAEGGTMRFVPVP